MKVYTAADQLIGHTPLLYLKKYQEKENVQQATILAKLGLLEGRHATCFPDLTSVLEENGAILTEGSVVVDGAVVPARTQVDRLRVTDAWPEDIAHYTRLKALDLRDSSVSDFTPVLSMDGLEQLDVRGNYAFTWQDYEAVTSAHPGCAVYWSIPVGDGHIDSTQTAVDLTDYGPSAEEVAELRQRFPDKTFTYAVTLMGKQIDPAAEAIDLQVLPQGQVPRGYDASKAACVNG